MGESGWRAPGTAVDRVDMVLIRAAACLRAVQLAVWIPVPLAGGLTMYRWPGLVLAGYLVAVAWTVLLFVQMFRLRRAQPGWLYADVLVALCGLVLVPAGCDGSCEPGWPHWVLPPAMGAAIMVAGFISRWTAVIAVGVLLAGYAAGSYRDLATSDGLGTVAHNSVSLVAFAALASVVTGHLRYNARELDTVNEAVRAATAREAAARARYDERTLQYDRLHQTVLTTLSLIARGRLDHRTAEVRALAQRDADYLRGLVTARAGPAANLANTLAGVVRDKQALGLQIHSQFHDLREALPEAVEQALANAVREALTNVDKHAGTYEAWLTAVGDDNGVTVRVVDRGCGFDPDSVTPGRGLIRELRHCVVEVGGRVTVDSAPGQGTIVEVSWRRSR